MINSLKKNRERDIPFNHFIEITKDNCDTGTEVPDRELIQNYTNKYNNMLSENLYTKTYPKDAKILALTTCLTKLYKTSLLTTVKRGGGNTNQTRTNTKKGTPTRIMLRDLRILNNVQSRN